MALPDAANIVLLASNYNPSIVSKEWLYQKGIFTESADNFIHTPILALVENKDIALAVDEQRLQLVVKRVTEDNLVKAAKMVCTFVNILPETPYKGLGFNYQYVIQKKCDLDAIFTPKATKLAKLFSKEYHLGTVLIFPFENFTVNFTITPKPSKDEKVTMAFNFHSDVNKVEEVLSRMSSQIATLQKTESIVQELCK